MGTCRCSLVATYHFKENDFLWRKVVLSSSLVRRLGKRKAVWVSIHLIAMVCCSLKWSGTVMTASRTSFPECAWLVSMWNKQTNKQTEKCLICIFETSKERYRTLCPQSPVAMSYIWNKILGVCLWFCTVQQIIGKYTYIGITLFLTVKMIYLSLNSLLHSAENKRTNFIYFLFVNLVVRSNLITNICGTENNKIVKDYHKLI